MLQPAKSNNNPILAIIPEIVSRQKKFLEGVSVDLSNAIEDIVHSGGVNPKEDGDLAHFYDSFILAINDYDDDNFDHETIGGDNFLQVGENFALLLEFMARTVRVVTQLFDEGIKTRHFMNVIDRFDEITTPFDD